MKKKKLTANQLLASAYRVVLASFFAALVLGQFARVELPVGAIYAHDLFLSALIILWLLDPQKIFPKVTPLLRAATIFIGVATISLVVNFTTLGSDSQFALFYLMRFVLYVTPLIIFADLRLRRIIALPLTTILSAVGLGLAVGGLAQYLFFPDTRMLLLLGWDDHYYRAIGTLFDPNFLGLLLVLTGVILVTTKPPLYQLLLGISGLTLLLTYSRSSFLAFFAALAVFTWTKKSFALGAVISLLFLASLLFLPRGPGEGVRLERLYSFNQRLESQQYALSLWRAYPFFGVGFNGYRHYLPKPQDPWRASLPQHPSAPDNSFIFVLATTGLIGFGAFSWLIFEILKKGKQNPLLLASTASIAIHALFNNSLFYPWVLLWLVTLLAETESIEL